VSRYEWLLFLHLIGAFATVGSVVVFSTLFVGGDRIAGPQLTFLGRRLWDVGGALTLIFGVWLALDEYDILDGWILTALVLWVIAAGAGTRMTETRSRAIYGVMAITTLALLVVMIYKPGA
jgi:hypothetical protein